MAALDLTFDVNQISVRSNVQRLKSNNHYRQTTFLAPECLYFLVLRYFQNAELKSVRNLITGSAVRRMEVPEDVELVKASECDEKEVPYHQYCTKLAVQLPAVGMRRHHQKDDSGEER